MPDVIERPTREDILMRQAQVVSDRSTCSRARVGVVIAHEARVVSQGYNGAPAGMPHCDHTCNCVGKAVFESRPANILASGPVFHDSGCAKTAACTLAVHAEANAIAFAAKNGVATMAGHLYTTMAPCLACAQLIINAGIHRVVYGSAYRYDEGLTLLMNAGIRVSSWPVVPRVVEG